MTFLRTRISVIIPAYNEEERICAVLDPVLASGAADEVIVVSDGSRDRTVEMARSVPGVEVVELPRNRGKAYAMSAGVAHSSGDIILFLDADLIGLHPEQVCALAEPVACGRAGMSLGIFGGGRFWTDLAQRIAPNISGQRALRRDVFLSIPDLADCGFGVEVAITGFARAHGIRLERVSFAGVTHPTKEEKLGFLRGERERLRMYAQILAYKLGAMCRSRQSQRERPVVLPEAQVPNHNGHSSLTAHGVRNGYNGHNTQSDTGQIGSDIALPMLGQQARQSEGDNRGHDTIV